MGASSLDSYISSWRERGRAREVARQDAQATALSTAGRVAAMLRERFRVGRVVLFGSLARGEWIPDRSDIDLAVEGLREEDWFRAVGAAQTCALGPVDVVRLEDATDSLRRSVELEGLDLA